MSMSITSVNVLEESPCPQGPIYKSVLGPQVLAIALDHKVLENFLGLRILQRVCYYNHVLNKFSYHHCA